MQPNVLILGTAEWDAPIATNQHFVTRELAKATNVTFVESLGLRRPTLRRDDLVRMASRVRKAFGNQPKVSVTRPRPERTSIVSPLVLPVHRAPTHAVNRALLRRATGEWLRSASPRVLWTFTPVTYRLEAAADVVIYHCVDLLATFPGVDAVAVARGESRLASHKPIAIATSAAVEEHLIRMGFGRVVLLPNVADVTVFGKSSKSAAQRQSTVLFAGNLSVHKLDMDLLESIAKSLRGHGELLLAGPLGAGGGGFAPELQRLEALGARHLGVLAHEQLAEVAGTCVVGLIPYAINDYTRGVSPLKCFEYLASGLSVLSTRLPAVEELAQVNPHVVAADAGDMPAQLMQMLRRTSDELIASRMAIAAEHGWSQRGHTLRELLTSELSGKR